MTADRGKSIAIRELVLSLPLLDTVEPAVVTAATVADGVSQGLPNVQHERGVWQQSADGPKARLQQTRRAEPRTAEGRRDVRQDDIQRDRADCTRRCV